jgi:hypothetical protein
MNTWITLCCIIGLITICYIVYPKIFPTTHAFWDQQPVIRSLTSKSSQQFSTSLIITDRKQFPKPTTNHNYQVYYFDIKAKRESIDLQRFWNAHFIKGYQYTIPFLQWSLPIINDGNICLRQGTTIIGTISTRQYSLVMGDDTRAIGYVDYLAIHKKYRNQRLAPILISETVARYPNQDRMSFVFRIEDNPLPFLPLLEYRYYVYSLEQLSNPISLFTPSQGLTALTKSDLKDAWNFYQQESQIYPFRVDLSLDEFERWFLPRPGVVYTYIKRNNGEITSIVSGFKCKVVNKSFFLTSQSVTIMEISLILSKPNILAMTGGIISDMYGFLKITEQIGVDYVVAPNTGPNKSFLKVLGFTPGKRCYLQLYNLSFNQQLAPGDVLFF